MHVVIASWRVTVPKNSMETWLAVSPASGEGCIMTALFLDVSKMHPLKEPSILRNIQRLVSAPFDFLQSSSVGQTNMATFRSNIKAPQ